MSVQIWKPAKQNALEKTLQELAQVLKSFEEKQGVYVSATPPTNPKKGDLWYSVIENRLYQYVE